MILVGGGGLSKWAVIGVAAILITGAVFTISALRWRAEREPATASGNAANGVLTFATTGASPAARFFSSDEVRVLMEHASKSDLGSVQAMLRRRPALALEKGKGGVSPLHAALFYQDSGAFETLLAAGFDRNAPAENKITPLMAAAMLPNSRFLSAGLAGMETVPNQLDLKGRDALHLAILNRQPVNVSLLLEKGADPNRPDARGSTPLMAAFQGRQPSPEIIRRLLNAGADPAAADHAGLRARDFAASFNDPRILAMIP